LIVGLHVIVIND